MQTTVDAQIQGGTPPDVFQVTYADLGRYSTTGQLLDVSPYLDAEAAWLFAGGAAATPRPRQPPPSGPPGAAPGHLDVLAAGRPEGARRGPLPAPPARLDGAGPWQQFRRITVPLVRPTTFFLVVLNVIYSFQVFDLVYAMTNGGPGFATTTLPFFAYQYGFQQREQGYGSAIGLVLLLAS